MCSSTNILLGGASIPFELINGLIIVKAEINGLPGNYIMDSGSNGVLLNQESLSSNVSYQTLSSTLEGSELEIKTLKVGDFELDRFLGFTTDLSALEVYLDKKIDGILGCSIFSPKSIMFDFEAFHIIISDQRIDESEFDWMGSLPITMHEDLPLVDIEMNGQTLRFILDTGASSHFIDDSVREKMSVKMTPTGKEKNIITAAGSEAIAKEYTIANCKLGSSNTQSIEAFEKDFDLISETMGMKISGLISVSKLSSSKVYIDLKSEKLHFD